MSEIHAREGADAHPPRDLRHSVHVSQLVPITVTLEVLDLMTDEQQRTLNRIVRDYRAASAIVARDTFMDGAITFALKDDRSTVYMGGLIEPDGRCHT